MTQLTIRSRSKALEAKLKELARERGCSLNQAANYLLCKGAGLLDEPPAPGIGDQLNEFIGSWTKAEAEALDRRIAETTETGSRIERQLRVQIVVR